MFKHFNKTHIKFETNTNRHLYDRSHIGAKINRFETHIDEYIYQAAVQQSGSEKGGLRAVLQKQRPLGRPDEPSADEQRSCSQAYICLRRIDISMHTNIKHIYMQAHQRVTAPVARPCHAKRFELDRTHSTHAMWRVVEGNQKGYVFTCIFLYK